MSDDSIQQLAQKLVDSLPAGIKNARDEVEQNFQAVLRAGLGKLDLVTREEFDVQEAVLAKTREKLETLEQRLKALEKDVER